MQTIKVLIIEDSKLMQELLTKILSSDPEIEILGCADDPLIAREMIKKFKPDVLTLDIMLPHMDGITFLKNLMRLYPIPVIMVSTLTGEKSAIALEALANGAIDYLEKPKLSEQNAITVFSELLVNYVKRAAKANVTKNIIPILPDLNLQEVLVQNQFLKKELIVIGASTGGIEAIETILLQLPRVLPPVIIVQHIKKEFNSAFSKRIQKLYGFSVVIPEENTQIQPGNIYVAPGDHHLLIKKTANHYYTFFDDGPPINNHKPSIDKLFNSVAKVAKKDCIGILLTGMGSDGAEGLRAIRNAGGTTIAQDKESSVVWGMPSAAIKLAAADYVISLNHIPLKILQILDSKMLDTTIN